MPTKAEIEEENAELREQLDAMKDDPKQRAALEQIAKLGGRQGAIATDALK